MSLPLPKILTTCIILLISGILMAADPEPVAVSNANLLEEQDILAEYDGGRILRQDVMDKINKLPAQHQGRFLTTDGQLQVLDIIATEEVFYQKALDMNIDKTKEVADRLADLDRRFYLQEYYRRNVTDLVQMTEADMEDYYNENLRLFFNAPNITIHYIQTASQQDALDAIEELNAGTSFAEVSDKYNQNTYAKGLRGVIKNVRLNGNIPGVGNDLELEALIQESAIDSAQVYGPLQSTNGWHIFRKISEIPGRQKSFPEVKNEIEQRLRPIKERELLEQVREQLKQKYAVVIDSAMVNRIDLAEKANNEDILEQYIVSAPNPILNITVGKLLLDFSKLSPQEQVFYTRGEGAIALAEQNLIQELFHIEAKELGYEQYFTENEDYRMLRRNTILRRTFEIMVLEDIEISDEEVKARYEMEKENYAQPPHRSIQVLFFEDNKTANKAWRKYKSALKKDNEKKIAKIIQDYSIKPDKAIYDNQYDNGIVTGLAQDADFSRRIWDNPVGYLSPVFTAANGEIVFFRTLSETPKSYRPAVEVEPRIYNAIKQEKEKAKQEQVTEELFVEYNMRKYPERIRLSLSAEQLFEYADNAARNRNYKDATTFYDQIIQNYPNGTDDYKAFFMKAFLVAEEIKDKDAAIMLFNEFLSRYPEGDLHESAQFMIDSLQGNLDGFEEFEDSLD
jgi:TolA-binding protein/parvulin-like peptidyl-prolyl isomerase